MSRKKYTKIEIYNEDEISKIKTRLEEGLSLLFEYDFGDSGHLSQWNPNKDEEDDLKTNIKSRQEIVMDIAASLGVPFEYKGNTIE